MPLGIDRICWVMALVGMKLCSLLCSDPATTFSARDFMPWLPEQVTSEQTPEEQIARSRMIALGGF